MITGKVREYIDRSVLCWLATSNAENEPNVSPKEMFTFQDDKTLLIAHIASPGSISNIKVNPNVCVSFVDVFIQKGYKIKGTARVIDQTDDSFKEKAQFLVDLFSDGFPIHAVIEIEVIKVESIQAPSYFLYPERSEQSQIASAMKTYKVKPSEEDY